MTIVNKDQNPKERILTMLWENIKLGWSHLKAKWELSLSYKSIRIGRKISLQAKRRQGRRCNKKMKQFRNKYNMNKIIQKCQNKKSQLLILSSKARISLFHHKYNKYKILSHKNQNRTNVKNHNGLIPKRRKTK